ncbi:hypothetical protein [Polyangium spumosum]|uniref:Outer membrane beta-barrel protein n=1 Tax=Polyangium spumosum TaxID=889282 RepID=A0A6N7PSL7_9BACT|nr:hypothetical protein [Polyangium spumosum]MRG93816.1 hypothetical protein [Polyangium spumosum]
MILRGGTVLAASLCLLAAPASAQETYRLDYLRGSGTDNCPSEAAFRAAITREVGRDPFRSDAPNLLTVIFRRSDKIVRVGIVAKSASGSEVHAPEHEKPAWKCAELLHHASFSAGMLIDPIEVPESEQPVVAAAASPPPPQTPPPPPPEPPPPSPAPRPRPILVARPPRIAAPIRFMISIGGGASFGSTPGLSPSVTAGFWLQYKYLMGNLEYRHDFKSSRKEHPFRIHGSQDAISFFPCWNAAIGPRVQIERCFRLSIWQTHSDVTHDNTVLQSEKTEAFTWGIGLRAGLSYTFTTLAIFGRLEVLGVPSPPVVEANGVEIWTYPHFSSAVQLGVAFDVARLTAKPSPPPPSQKISPTIGTSEGSGDI